MSEFISSKNDKYTLQKGYERGEVVILSDEKAAWRISKRALSQASSVFRDMFEGNTDATNEIHLSDFSNAELRFFLDAITHQTHPSLHPSSYHTKRMIALLIEYECIDEAKHMLYNSVANLGYANHFEAFALASQIKDYRSVCRILLQGHQYWLGDRHKGEWSGPKYGYPSLYPALRERRWTEAESHQVANGWLLALMLACDSYPIPTEIGPLRKKNSTPKSDIRSKKNH